jgi:hypothetical protein
MTITYSEHRLDLDSLAIPIPSNKSVSRISVAESTNSYINFLVLDRFKRLNSCSFSVPSSDNRIRADTHEGGVNYSLPDERDEFTVVRRYLYNILTSTEWGINDKWPAAVRCTVESWYGNGGFFRAQCEEESGLSDFCPEEGSDDQGNEVSFQDATRKKINDCVRFESRKLMQRERDLENAASAAGSYTDDGVAEEQGDAEAPRDEVLNLELLQDRQSLHSNDCSSVYSEAGEDESKPRELPARYDSARSSRALSPDVSTSEKIASSYMNLFCSSWALEATHSPSPHELLQCTPDEATKVLKRQTTSEEKRNSTQNTTSTKVLNTTDVRPKRSFIKHMISVKDFGTAPASPPKEVHGRRPSGYKQAKLGVTPSTEAKPSISREVVTTMNEIMQGRKGTQLRRPPVKKHKESTKKGPEVTTSEKPRKTTINCTTPLVTLARDKKYEKQKEAIVAAATAAAHRAGQLKLEETRLLNHHCERKRAGFFTRLFRKTRGKQKEKYCADIAAWDCSYSW